MSDQLREFLANMLDWQQAHASFDSAIADLPAKLRGERPEGLPYSVWELVEHIRIAQNDILEFTRDPGYKEDKKWPDDYWPETPAPPTAEAWEASIDRYHEDPWCTTLSTSARRGNRSASHRWWQYRQPSGRLSVPRQGPAPGRGC